MARKARLKYNGEVFYPRASLDNLDGGGGFYCLRPSSYSRQSGEIYASAFTSGGGVASKVTVTGLVHVSNGAVVNSGTVRNGAALTIFRGGMASYITVSSGGSLYVSGKALNVKSNTGAVISVYTGGSITYV